jgi:hypothetical protein
VTVGADAQVPWCTATDTSAAQASDRGRMPGVMHSIRPARHSNCHTPAHFGPAGASRTESSHNFVAAQAPPESELVLSMVRTSHLAAEPTLASNARREQPSFLLTHWRCHQLVRPMNAVWRTSRPDECCPFRQRCLSRIRRVFCGHAVLGGQRIPDMRRWTSAFMATGTNALFRN